MSMKKEVDRLRKNLIEAANILEKGGTNDEVFRIIGEALIETGYSLLQLSIAMRRERVYKIAIKN